MQNSFKIEIQPIVHDLHNSRIYIDIKFWLILSTIVYRPILLPYCWKITTLTKSFKIHMWKYGNFDGNIKKMAETWSYLVETGKILFQIPNFTYDILKICIAC